ncbi:hypothetical protein CEP53_005573 [Fusarium sp. AF-6]|nr:hypothetical protein CEP53_005573 [Fusarium sp. AF-6]
MPKKIFLSFLDEIPNAKLEGFTLQNRQATLYTQKEENGRNYRLDKHGMTSDNYHSLEIRPNKEAKSTSVRKEKRVLAAVHVLEGSDPAVEPKDVRKAFKDSYENGGSVEKLGTAPVPEQELEQEPEQEPEQQWPEQEPEQ